ncbi:hypothetical protein ACE6H2_016184 [Prunus campanulata]
MKRTHRGTIEASSSRLDREHPTASTRRHRVAMFAPQDDQPQHGPLDHLEDTTEVEDIATTHNTNVKIDAEPTEPSRVGSIDQSLLTSFKSHIVATIWNNHSNLLGFLIGMQIRLFYLPSLRGGIFHMPFGEITITLDEVPSILGIPMSSAVISPFEDDNDTNYELLVNYLRVTDEEATEQLH